MKGTFDETLARRKRESEKLSRKDHYDRASPIGQSMQVEIATSESVSVFLCEILYNAWRQGK